MSKLMFRLLKLAFARVWITNKGACAYSREDFLETLSIPDDLLISVMLVCLWTGGFLRPISLTRPFPFKASKSKVDIKVLHVITMKLIYFACNWSFEWDGLPCCYKFNANLWLYWIKILEVISLISSSKAETLYFADSRGCMKPSDTANIVSNIKQAWHGQRTHQYNAGTFFQHLRFQWWCLPAPSHCHWYGPRAR